MKTITVDGSLYRALKAAADRNGRSVHELLNEAIKSWLADAAMDDADHSAIERSRLEATGQGEIEFEAFFTDCWRTRTDWRGRIGLHWPQPHSVTRTSSR